VNWERERTHQQKIGRGGERRSPVHYDGIKEEKGKRKKKDMKIHDCLLPLYHLKGDSGERKRGGREKIRKQLAMTFSPISSHTRRYGEKGSKKEKGTARLILQSVPCLMITLKEGGRETPNAPLSRAG